MINNKKAKNLFFKLNLKYFLFQLIPISIMIFFQFYQFRIVSVEKQTEVIRRIIETKIVASYNDLCKIKSIGEDSIYLNKFDKGLNFISEPSQLKIEEQDIEPYMSLVSSNNIIITENMINVLNKEINYNDNVINTIIDCCKMGDCFHVIIEKSDEDNITIYLSYNNEHNLYIIQNKLIIKNFNIGIEELEMSREKIDQFFFQKKFQIDLNKMIDTNQIFLFSLDYKNLSSLNMYVYILIFSFFQLFWQFSGQYFATKRLVSNDTQYLENYIEVSINNKLKLIENEDNLQFPQLFELGKKINGVSQIYSKLYREMSKNKMEIQTMINNIPEQIFKIDKDFNIINSNNVQTSLTEYFQYELNNSKFFDLIEDNESKNNLFRRMYNIYVNRLNYYKNPYDENKNKEIINKIGQLQYQNFNLVEKISNQKQNKYQNFQISGLDIKIKTKSGKNIDVKCNVSCISDNEYIVSLSDVSHEKIQQEKINTLYNLQIELIKKDDINVNKLLLKFQYIIKQDSQYLLKINGNSLDVEYGVVTDDNFKGLIEHQETLDFRKLNDVQEIIDYSEEILINDVQSLENDYLKQWLNGMGIKTCLQFKIESKENNILYSFGIDFQNKQLSEQELQEAQDLQRLFKNIILNYLIQKEVLKVTKEVNETNNQILNNIFDFIYQIDKDERIIFANDKIQDALGTTVEDLLFKNYLEQLEINDFYKEKVRKDNESIFKNKMKVVEDSQFVLGNISFRGTLLRKYQEIMGSPQIVVNFKQHQDITNIESMNKLINRKTLFIDDIMLKINNQGIILKQFIPFGQDYEMLKLFKHSNGENLIKIIYENIKNKDVQISLNSKIQEILNGDLLYDFEKIIQFEDTFNINDIEHLKLKFIFNRQTDNNINVIIQTKI